MTSTTATALWACTACLALQPAGQQPATLGLSGQLQAKSPPNRWMVLHVQTDKQSLKPGEWVHVRILADTIPKKGEKATVNYQGKAYTGIVNYYMMSLFDVHVVTKDPVLPWPWEGFEFHSLMNYNTQPPDVSQTAIAKILCSQVWSMYAYGKVDDNLPIEICSFNWRAPPVWQTSEYDFVIKVGQSPGYIGWVVCDVPELGKSLLTKDWPLAELINKTIIVDPALGCSADCDADESLTINDFVCFQTYFALGNLTADCDGDGQLLIDDFICFQTAYAIGC